MQKSKYSCVIFDCDGTLVDTLEDIAAAMNRSLDIHGFPEVPPEKYKDMVGWGIVRLASLALPQGTEDQLVKKVAAEAARFAYENPLIKSRPYPGIAELAAELKARKIKTAVLSNKRDEVLRRVIEGLFSPGLFDAVIGERPGMGCKPDPAPVWELLAELDCSPGSAIFAGDSEIDIETARNSGCYPLGVSWGFRPRSTLETAGAARIIDSPGEIWELFEKQ
jgi:phosphoglycolate phosphatase